MRSLWCFLSLLLLQVGVVESEKVSLDLILDADSEEVHYVRGENIFSFFFFSKFFDCLSPC